jgi:hypothetical protein
LEIYPLLSTKLLEFKVTAAVELVWIAILLPESMVMSPLLAVVSAVLVPLDISVAACADTVTAPASGTNETAQSIRRCINQASNFAGRRRHFFLANKAHHQAILSPAIPV